MSDLKAEVMSVGDEIISGQRLDTNSQWLSLELGQLGIPIHFHSSVGDDLDDHVSALKLAIERADIVVLTGGLGPTADDLTRAAMAEAFGAELKLESSVLAAIEKIFARSGREMPANNEAQAWFPAGSIVIPNPEGTAPGIDLTVEREGRGSARIFSLPGVPAEMKQMWLATVKPALREFANAELTYHYHTLNCFGAGESTIESMLPDLVKRGRDPKVGITASAATITLRVSTRGKTKVDCCQKMLPTIDTIRNSLGNLIFGEQDQSLPEVVLELLRLSRLKVAIADFGLDGEVASEFVNESEIVKGTRVSSEDPSLIDLTDKAVEICKKFKTEIGVAIGPLNLNDAEIAAGRSNFSVVITGPLANVQETFRFGGHSDWRRQRAVKQVLNMLRLYLLQL